MIRSTISLLLASPAFAVACSCPPLPPVTEAYSSASAVFYGEVVRSRAGSPLFGSVIYELKVVEDFKGSSTAYSVESPNEGPACGVLLETGKRYLIYAVADTDGRKLRTSACMRTRPSAWIQELSVEDELSILKVISEKKAAEPGATDNPDDAQR